VGCNWEMGMGMGMGMRIAMGIGMGQAQEQDGKIHMSGGVWGRESRAHVQCIDA
jgi:hypothetical protein